jgi:glycosyltransferase involved in cell wall biosynthesis
MVVFSPYPADPRPRRAVEALLKEGMSVDLICEGDQDSPRREELDGLEVRRIPIRRSRGGPLAYLYQYAAFTLISASILAWRTLKRRYHLIHVHNMPDVLVASSLVPKALGAKVILDQHDPMPELMMTIFGLGPDSFAVRLIKRLEKWSIARANLVVTVNLACKQIFSARSCHADKIGVVMNSPDSEIFPLHRPESYRSHSQCLMDPFVIMYHGSLVERNGLDLAIRAVELVRATVPRVELRIYGRSTPFLEKMLQLVRNRSLEDCVRYLGPKRLEELAVEIDKCDVGVVPNPRNAFTEINTPTRIFEYLALGKPVIAPRTAGIQDYFSENSLLFFDPGSAEQLARQIEHVYQSPSETDEIALRGQAVYLAHSWQQERQTFVKLVSELLGRGKAS